MEHGKDEDSDAKVAAVVKERGEASGESGERADGECNVEEREAGEAERSHREDGWRDGLITAMGDGGENGEREKKDKRGRDDCEVVETLVAVPLDSPVRDAHGRFEAWGMSVRERSERVAKEAQSARASRTGMTIQVRR